MATPDTRLIDVMLSGWNMRDPASLRDVVARSLCLDVEFCDPHSDIRGHAAFIELVEAFWVKNPACTIMRSSSIDAHHDRARYAWLIKGKDGRPFEGVDIVALDLPSGKVRRVDGFFGPLTAA